MPLRASSERTMLRHGGDARTLASSLRQKKGRQAVTRSLTWGLAKVRVRLAFISLIGVHFPIEISSFPGGWP